MVLQAQGVAHVAVSHATHAAEVHYDPAAIRPEDIAEVIDDCGFDAEVLDESAAHSVRCDLPVCCATNMVQAVEDCSTLCEVCPNSFPSAPNTSLMWSETAALLQIRWTQARFTLYGALWCIFCCSTCVVEIAEVMDDCGFDAEVLDECAAHFVWCVPAEYLSSLR